MERGNWWRKPEVWRRCALALGLGLRLYHYAQNPSVWHDEAALLVNVLGKGFRDLVGPLTFGEAAPPLFLWLERAMSRLAGDGLLALRLVPFLASCAALWLLVPVARRLLSPSAVPWAILLAACSNRLLWHSCEAKPYAVDVLVATLVPALFVATRSWPLGRQLLLFSVAAPGLIFLSYPACFLFGGLLAAVIPALRRERTRNGWLGFGALSAIVAGSFLLLLAGPIHAQRCEIMSRCWEDHFPHWQRFWTVPAWTLASSLDVVRYCHEPAGHALALVGVAGGIRLWRSGRRTWVVLLGVPAGLALLASYLHAYPWGGARVEVFLLPATTLLIAAGIPPLWSWLLARTRLGTFALAALLLASPALTAYRLVVPWMRADCGGAAAYVLTNRHAEEPISANHWEYLYYFRDHALPFTPLEDLTASPGSPVWLVLTNPNEQDRLQMDRYLSFGDWQILDWREFAETMVYRLGRRQTSPDRQQTERDGLQDSAPLSPRAEAPRDGVAAGRFCYTEPNHDRPRVFSGAPAR
jgi:hypothetical protein